MLKRKSAPVKKAVPIIKKASEAIQKATALKKPVVKKSLPKIKYPLFCSTNGREIKDLDYFASDIRDEFDEYEIIIKLSENEKFNFKFCVNQSPFCCGFIELGNFRMPVYANEKQSNALLHLFDTLSKENEFQLFICTVTSTCQILEKALSESKFWTQVKSFNNPNTINKITLWVSNK